ncbi:hypothetical protein ACFXTN_031590 [Malus domestica]
MVLDKLEKIKIAARKFFALPLEEKWKVRRDEKSLLVEEPTLAPALPEPDDKEETKWCNQWPKYPREYR